MLSVALLPQRQGSRMGGATRVCSRASPFKGKAFCTSKEQPTPAVIDNTGPPCSVLLLCACVRSHSCLRATARWQLYLQMVPPLLNALSVRAQLVASTTTQVRPGASNFSRGEGSV